MKEILDLISALFNFIIKSIAGIREVWVMLLAFSAAFILVLFVIENRGKRSVRPWLFSVSAIIFLIGFWLSVVSIAYNLIN